jgi:hypothetical protein
MFCWGRSTSVLVRQGRTLLDSFPQAKQRALHDAVLAVRVMDSALADTLTRFRISDVNRIVRESDMSNLGSVLNRVLDRQHAAPLHPKLERIRKRANAKNLTAARVPSLKRGTLAAVC